MFKYVLLSLFILSNISNVSCNNELLEILENENRYDMDVLRDVLIQVSEIVDNDKLPPLPSFTYYFHELLNKRSKFYNYNNVIKTLIFLNNKYGWNLIAERNNNNNNYNVYFRNNYPVNFAKFYYTEYDEIKYIKDMSMTMYNNKFNTDNLRIVNKRKVACIQVFDKYSKTHFIRYLLGDVKGGQFTFINPCETFFMLNDGRTYNLEYVSRTFVQNVVVE